MMKKQNLQGKSLWDSWLIKEKGIYHIFFLQAEPSTNNEQRDNGFISIGHAVSKDLINWEKRTDALGPGKKGEWDSLNLWSGSVIKKDNQFYMFYTGRSKDKNSKIFQKIGLATSDNLNHWQKYNQNPILEAKKYYYINGQKNKLGNVDAWRDPYVFFDPQTKKYYLTITAREKNDKTEYDGCVGLAQSDDLFSWKILPPIFSPGIFDEIETTQVIYLNKYYYLFFSAHKKNYKPSYAQKYGAYGGLHCYYSKNFFGGYKPINQTGIVLNNEKEMYDVRLIYDKRNVFYALGWLNKTKEQKFVGKLSQPFKIKIKKDRIFKLK